jgi:hypothetical protein
MSSGAPNQSVIARPARLALVHRRWTTELDSPRCLIGLIIGALVAGCEGQTISDASGTDASTAPLHCNAPKTAATLYHGGVTGLAVVGGQAVFVDQALFRVPLGGGSPTMLAKVDEAYGLVVGGGFAYFTGSHAVGSVDPQGKQPSESALFSAPITGGDPTLVRDQFSWLYAVGDESSVYIAGPATGDILRFTPPSTTPTRLNIGQLSIRALTAHGSDLYAAAEDLSNSGAPHGAIVRVPKKGGAALKLVVTAGLPDDIAVDDHGIYWIEGPPYGTFGSGRIAGGDLNGGHVVTLSTTSANAIALDDLYIYFVSDTLSRIPKSGGPAETLAHGLEGPGLLRISGADAIWVDLFTKALSDPRPSALMALCASVGG